MQDDWSTNPSLLSNLLFVLIVIRVFDGLEISSNTNACQRKQSLLLSSMELCNVNIVNDERRVQGPCCSPESVTFSSCFLLLQEDHMKLYSSVKARQGKACMYVCMHYICIYACIYSCKNSFGVKKAQLSILPTSECMKRLVTTRFYLMMLPRLSMLYM